MRRVKIYIIISGLMLLPACEQWKGGVAARPGPPWQAWMFDGPPPGREYTPLYVQGWKDGCESGTSASSNQWYKMFYKFKQGAILAQNRVYYKGWKDSFDYCQRYIYQYTRRHVL